MIYRLTDAKTLQLMELLRIVAERNLTQVERILRGLSCSEDSPEPVSRADLAVRLAEGSVIVLRVGFAPQIDGRGARKTSDRPKPVIGQTMGQILGCGLDPAATIMAANDDLAHMQRIDSELQCR